MNKTYVIYHANCLDGMTAAAVAFMKFGNSVTYLPGKYQELDLDSFERDDLILLDFSFDEPTINKLMAKGCQIRIIDHHEEPISKIAHMPLTELVYDVNESGATLAWNYFFKGHELPRMIEHARDYDLFHRKMPGTDAFITYLEQHPLDIPTFVKLIKDMEDPGLYQSALDIGGPLFQYKTTLIEGILNEARPCVIDGENGWIVNGPYALASMIGSIQSNKTQAYTLIWSERADGKVTLSFRDIAGHTAQRLAQLMGGNGHPRAAGATISKKTFNALLIDSERKLIKEDGLTP
ncbi:phosphoesterase dhha1 [Pseudomonas putida]|nr:phosphoesterase dhha1 [Pseudomonas putida]